MAFDIRHGGRASPDAAPIAQSSSHAFPITPTAAPLLAKNLPEPQCFIPGTRDDRRPVRAHAQIQHPIRMPGQTGNLLHARILPHHDLVLAVAVRAGDLIRVLAPCKVAHLGAGVDFFDEGARGCIPELDGAVCCAATRGKEVVLVRRPGYSFHGGHVRAEAVQRGLRELIPDEEFVIVSARGELAIIAVPA